MYNPEANLLSEFALATLGAFGLGLPIAVAIIWIVPDPVSLDAVRRANNSPTRNDRYCRITSTHRAAVRPDCGQIFDHL